MFPNSNQIPEAVKKLVEQYKSDPKSFELMIYGDLVTLFEKTSIKVEGQEFDTVLLGKQIGRAYWKDAESLSLERAKEILGIK